MSVRRDQTVSRTLLFDRLAGSKGSDSEAGRRALTREQTLASIQRELSRLLNTRVPKSASDLLHKPRTVIDYGIPEIGAFNPYDDRNTFLLETLLTDTINTFEPRLSDVRVSVQRIQDQRRSVILMIDAFFECDSIRSPVSFAIAVDRPELEAGVDSGHDV